MTPQIWQEINNKYLLLQQKTNIKVYWITRLNFLNCYNYFEHVKSQIYPRILVFKLQILFFSRQKYLGGAKGQIWI